MNDSTEQAEGSAIADANVPDAADVEAAPENVSAPSPDASDSGEKSAAPGLQKRIDELTRKWRTAERERDFERSERMRAATAEQPKAPDPVAADAPVKTLADFGYDETQFAKYIRDEARSFARQEAEAVIKREREAEKTARTKSTYDQKVEAFVKDAPDFYEVFHNDLPVSQAMAEVIVQSDDGPALAYHLGKNPDVAAQLAKLPPTLAARELGRIEARIQFEREQAKAAKPPVSKAPAPPPRIESENAGISARTTDNTGDTLSDKEWFALEEKRLQKLRNRNG